MTAPFDIFMVATPGLEQALLAEARANGFDEAEITPGGITFTGTWQDVWRANLVMRGATRVLARVGSFMAFHLAQLDKRSRKFPWGDILRPDVPMRVEVSTSKKSKIYHAGAATQRIETALKDSHGMTIAADAPVVIKVRIDDNRVTISVDTSGISLHKRGHKEAVGKAPMRETLAALMLRECGYDGSEPVLDPMCGSGTFLIEAAEIAMGLYPGRTRNFAFEQLATFDHSIWDELRKVNAIQPPSQHFHGSDRDAGAIRMATANAERAGVGDHITFQNLSAADIKRPDGPPGLIICNPPYGGRIGNQNMLYGVYAGLGDAIKREFSGWRVGMVTSEAGLAKAAGLPFKPKGAPIPHGGLKVWLFQTGPL
ncbi:THUMP domain-containing class I SAM-dependent RNA methyltransferase [Roseobacter sp. CCS2]|uniref:THUMP domain-containing class I SAM-dependent RNA methyltransferase n=1 Tax=Roseobacter sp. CCS2 TaxID=391593 RepID=UPI0000F401A8|nr:class I SAM-dependent RNA methyltransferase [Roseobacter sp. CCS2]EBA13876.1 putative RNA methylase [Roseobacter sp. CCS2]